MHLRDDTLRSIALPPRAMDRGLDGEAMRRRIASRLFDEVAEPVRVGRFRVVGNLGEGGMGVVLSAFDDALDRPVAIKILADRRMPRDSGEHARLVREARSLAKLSHPNVVQVYEVGEYEGGVFIAMELVRGTNLRQWLAAERRPLADILARFLAAAHGLAAAHYVGVVHRDFKPSNALVGEDGRVRIADFGLARGLLPSRPDRNPVSASPDAATTTESRQTLGTPAYMSPEQLRGEEVDARSDQYSFFVALHEAVYGHRPEVARPRPPGVEPRAVPRWLRRLISRGLALRPDERHASMADVIDALQAGPRRRHRRLQAAGVGLSLVAAVVVGGLLTRQPSRGLCPDPLPQLAGVWDTDQRAAVRAAFAASDLGYAEPTHVRVERALDAYAARWVDARRGTCEATWIRGEQSPELLDDSMRCLDSARAALTTRVRVLASAGPAIIADADAIVADLPSPEQCRDAHALVMQRHHARSINPDVAADLDRARVHFQIRQGPEAATLLHAVLDRLRVTDDPAGEAEALLLLGKTQARLLREPNTALATLDDAFARAAVGERHELSWDIWTDQAWVRAVDLDDTTEARRLLGYARSSLHSLRSTDPLPGAAIQAVEATILAAEGRADEAVQLRRSIVDTLRGQLVADHPTLLAARDALADTLGAAGKTAEQATLRDELLAELASTYGPDHPLTARCEQNLGMELYERDDLPAARKHLAHARDALAATYGPRSPVVAAADLMLAQVEAADGACDRAITLVEPTLEILDRTLPRNHANRIVALTVLTNCLGLRPDQSELHDELLALYLELLAIHDADPVLDSIDVPATLINIGETLCALGRCNEALPYWQRLSTLYQQHPPDEPEMQAFPLRGIGLVHLAAERPALALPFLEEAWQLLRQSPLAREGMAQNLTATARDLARALAATRHSPARVRSLRRFADAPAGASPPA